MRPLAVLALAPMLAAGLGGPAGAETQTAIPTLVLSRTSPWTVDPSRVVSVTAWEAPVRRAAVTLPIGERVELVAIGSREKPPKAWSALRRSSGPAGRSSTSKGARVGLVMQW